MKNIKTASRALERAMRCLFTVFGLITVLFVLLITTFLLIYGIPAIREIGFWNFITGRRWAPTAADPAYGILPFILSSVFGTLGAVAIGVPLGLLCGVFLAKMAPRGVAGGVRGAVELLAGIPSVVYGLVGMMIIVPTVREVFGLPDGANMFSAIIVLTVMILPTVISVSETSLRAVPREYEEASLALGATKIETVFRVSLPAARSGILTSVVLGVGRAIGEAMAIMMVSGNVPNMPGLFTSVRFLTTAVASEMSYASGLQREALFSVSLVLFVFIMAINILLGLIGWRRDK